MYCRLTIRFIQYTEETSFILTHTQLHFQPDSPPPPHLPSPLDVRSAELPPGRAIFRSYRQFLNRQGEGLCCHRPGTTGFRFGNKGCAIVRIWEQRTCYIIFSYRHVSAALSLLNKVCNSIDSGYKSYPC